MKKILSILLVLAMVLSCLPMTALAAEAGAESSLTPTPESEITVENATEPLSETFPEESIPQTEVPAEFSEKTIVNEFPITLTTEANTSSTQATSGTCGENLTWSFNNGILTISGTGEMQKYDFKTTPWYEFSDEISKVIISSNVTSISPFAFYYCENLSSITIPDNVDYIGNYAFYSCASLSSIAIPNKVTYIGDCAFSSCISLTTVTIPDSVTYIGSSAFSHCSALISIQISKNVSYIGSGAFSTCSSLNSIVIPDSLTAISDGLFLQCRNLQEITMSNNITSIGDAAFGSCKSLSNITIPNSVTFIDSFAFEFCSSLNNVIIPSSVTSIGYGAFNHCSGLKSISFHGNAPAMNENPFLSVTTTAYYPANNITWTADVLQNYGGTVTWVPDSSIPGNSPVQSTCTLEELTDVDYLAFSSFAYIPAADVSLESTIKEVLTANGKWNLPWENTDFFYSKLFDHIANWKIYRVRENNYTGFAAYAFENDQGEVVISYRGSSSDTLGEIITDWIINDINMILGGEGSQVSNAIAFSKSIVTLKGKENVRLTGHSLGGGLCDIVSARFDCKATSFNAAPFLGIAYNYYPEEMGQLFSGTAEWKFEDHVINGDILVGELGTALKNVILHSPSPGNEASIDAPFKPHLLPAFIYEEIDGTLYLTNNKPLQKVTTPVTTNLSTLFPVNFLFTHKISPYIRLGTIASDRIHINLLTAMAEGTTTFSGNGDDEISGGIKSDIICGGKGHDLLVGSLDADDYYYFKGDGVDYIFDSSGKDTIHLEGFESSDTITVEQNDKFVKLIHNGSVFLNISRDRYWLAPQIEVKVSNASILDLTDYMNPRKAWGSVAVACPVSMEIVNDATGEVIHTLHNSQDSIGVQYLDCGYLYVYEDENGELIKMAELFEGYSIRIQGEDTGTMDIAFFETGADGEAAMLSAADVPVTGKFTATVEKESDGIYLAIDSDGNGSVDSRRKLAEDYTVTFDSNGGSGSMEAITISVGEELLLPECTFTAPEGKEFKAWNINGTEYAVGDSLIPQENVTVSAVWSSNSLWGDVNGDGKINSRDILAILQFRAGKDVTINETAADVNQDGKINSRDILQILQYRAST